MAAREHTNLPPVDRDRVPTPHRVPHPKALAKQYDHRGLDVDRIAVAGGTQETRRGVDERRPDDARRGLHLAPCRHSAGPEKAQRCGIHPPEVIGVEHDLRRVHATELNAEVADMTSAHRSPDMK